MNSTRSRRWSRLDNAAKIFPSNSTPSDSKVFRFACELTEPVEAPLLQQASRWTRRPSRPPWSGPWSASPCTGR